MSSFRQELKSGIDHAHNELEKQYPFSHLMESENIETTVNDALACFKAMFISFLHLKKNNNLYYLKNFNALNTFNHDFRLEQVLTDESIDINAFEYLFLGSRMGNKLIVRNNPDILSIDHSEYFSNELPMEIWTDLLKKITSITNKDDQKKFIVDVNRLFIKLKSYAQIVESQRNLLNK